MHVSKKANTPVFIVVSGCPGVSVVKEKEARRSQAIDHLSGSHDHDKEPTGSACLGHKKIPPY